MQDRFKFKLWDKTQKRIILPLSFSINATGEIKILNDFGSTKWFDYENDYVLIQCTGLRDKNGKLIYEGDIVKFNYDTDEIIAVVSWDDNDGQIGYYLNTTDYLKDKYVTDYDFYKNDYEILGNIYENPELLKEYEDE